MKKIVYCLLFSFPFLTSAQSLSITQLWESLSERLEYAQDSLLLRIREEERNELRTARLPVFYADANLQRNLIIPITPVPAIAFDPDAREGAIIPLQFATKWSSKAGVQMEWDIFDPSRRSDEQEKALDIQKTEIQKAQNVQQWKHDATLAYTSVILASQQYKIARLDSAAYADILAVSKARFQAGREPSSSYLAAQQEFERKRIHLHEAWAVLCDADLELRRYADLADIASLSTDIQGIRTHLQTYEKDNYTIKSLETDQQIARIQQQRAKRQLLPILSLNAYLGQQYFSNELRLDRGREWYGSSFLNMALSIPLSAYFTSRPTLRKAALADARLAQQIQQEERDELIRGQQLAAKISNATQKTEGLARIEQLALQHKEEQEAAYRAGRLLLTDYNESILAYNKCKQDVWQAEYDLIELLLESL